VVGNAPLRPVSLSAGEHKLEISHPNHAKIVQGINIAGGAELKLNFTLQPVTGQVSINSTPAGADVEIDGRSWGKTPLNDLKLPVGSHVVQIKYPGYQAVQRQVNISPQQSENISVVLSQGSSGPTETGNKPWFKSWPGWTALVLGLAAGGVGTYFLVTASQGHQSVKDMANSPSTHSLSQQQLMTQWNQHNTNEQIGYGLAGAAGGLVVLSIILFATRAAVSPETTSTKTSLYMLPQTAPAQRAQGTLLYTSP
ncbi:MAG: PEGA domain-containing protein, partial [Myxococcales bacterium]|nr:PEGA domain-containing protein [Myxococcales bacterium]